MSKLDVKNIEFLLKNLGTLEDKGEQSRYIKDAQQAIRKTIEDFPTVRVAKSGTTKHYKSKARKTGGQPNSSSRRPSRTNLPPPLNVAPKRKRASVSKVKIFKTQEER